MTREAYKVSVSTEVAGKAGGGGEVEAVELHGRPAHHVEGELAHVAIVGLSGHPGVDRAVVVHHHPIRHRAGPSRLCKKGNKNFLCQCQVRFKNTILFPDFLLETNYFQIF